MDTAKFISPIALDAALRALDHPLVFDVRKGEDFAQSAYFIPGAIRWDYHANASWPLLPHEVFSNATEAGRRAVAYCVKGAHVGIEGAERLSAGGLPATALEGGLNAWQSAGLPLVRKRPDLGVDGESVSRWVTRERPKIDRIACPWLIRRFIDPRAEFFYIPAAQVFQFAKENHAIAYDITGAPLEHDGELCSFDAFLKAFELNSAALNRLASIVRAADTDALHLAPQASGLLAISLGLSRNFANDDHAMLAQGMMIYDALYRYCAETENETHQWIPSK